MKRKFNSKRNYFGYIITIITVVLLFLVVPRIIIFRGKKLIKTELEIKTTQPPDSIFYIGLNYVKIASFFPGFNEKGTDIYDDAISRIYGRYQISYAMLKDSTIDILINKTRKKRDSILDIKTLSEHNKILRQFDSIEDEIFETKWLEKINKSEKNAFCIKWELFFEKTEMQANDFCEKTGDSLQ